MPDTLSATAISEGLLRHNYFPRIGGKGDELPPCFTSESFTRAKARKLLSLANQTGGYDSVAIKATRFNMIPRRLDMPHPQAYAHLVLGIEEFWSAISARSMDPDGFRPRLEDDGRIFAMASIPPRKRVKFGSRYRARADVSHFYHSIYTHALAWALVGRDRAKATTKDRTWYNRLDHLYALAHRAETTGVAIGPGTSAIAGEIILTGVDELLSGYEFTRIVDDYEFNAPDEATAEQFVLDLGVALESHNLALNPRKTEIVELPVAASPAWLREMRESVRTIRWWSTRDALDLLDKALEIGAGQPEASALRFALKAIERHPTVANSDFFDSLADLAFHQPIAVPFLCRLLLTQNAAKVTSYRVRINRLITQHADHGRSDATTWLLYLAIRSRVPLSKLTVTSILEAKDCLSLVLLFHAGSKMTKSKVVRFARDLIDVNDPYLADTYWLLLYELQRLGELVPSKLDASFVKLIKNDVVFVNLDLNPPPNHDPWTDDPDPMFLGDEY